MSAATIYRYVEVDPARVRDSERRDVRDGELELEITLRIRGYMERGYGFLLESATLDGREFPLAKQEVLDIEVAETLDEADRDLGRMEEEADRRADR